MVSRSRCIQSKDCLNRLPNINFRDTKFKSLIIVCLNKYNYGSIVILKNVLDRTQIIIQTAQKCIIINGIIE